MFSRAGGYSFLTMVCYKLLFFAGIPYKELAIGVPKETFTNEKRVAIIPATVQALTKKGFTVNIEENAGVEAKFTNDMYAASGGNVTNSKSVYDSDIILKVSDVILRIEVVGIIFSGIYLLN